MNDRAKTNSQPIKEITVLKKKIKELEQAESKRKEMDQAFRQSEEKYRSLIENIQDGIYILDSFGKFTFVNDVIVKRSGFPAEWFLGRSYLDVIIKEDHERVQRHFNAVMDGKTQIYDLTYPSKSGNLLHVEVCTAPLFDNAKVIGLLGISRNINERKRVEEEKRRSQEKADWLTGEIAVIAEIGRVIGSTLDIDNVYESFALQAQKLVSFDRLSVDLNNPDEATMTVTYVSGIDIPGRRPGDTVPLAGTISEAILRKRTGLLINTTSVEEITGRLSHMTNIATVRAGMRSLISVPLISKDEVIGALHFRSKKLNVYTEQDLCLAQQIGAQIAGAIASAQLYSNLKRMEKALRRNEQQLKSYIEGAGDAIYVLKTDTGRILSCNSRACLDLGYSRDELVKLSATDIESRLSSGEIDAIHSDLKPGEVKTFEGMHKRKDGSVFPVEIRLSQEFKSKTAKNLIYGCNNNLLYCYLL